jgi:hypothetical protein
MPFPVACPVCGTDGTSAANELLAQSLRSEAVRDPEPAATPPPRAVSVAAPAASRLMAAPSADTAARPARLLPGQVDRPHAELEARAKIFWGDPREEVIKFLMRNNIPHEEAAALVESLLTERAAATRSNGIGKIVTGSGMACVPVAAWFIFSRIGVLPMKIFAVCVMVGLWGAYRILKGTIMAVSPRSESGDVADQ